MVVRQILGLVAARLPYSDCILGSIRGVLSEAEKIPEETKVSTPKKTHEPRTLSPRAKIHSRILDRRCLDDEIGFYYADTCDAFPAGLEFSPIHKLKQVSAPQSRSRGSTWSSDVDGTFVESKISLPQKIAAIPEETEEEEPEKVENSTLDEHFVAKQARVKQYLDEQNDKFDTLINRNLEAFMEADNGKQDINALLVDLIGSRDASMSQKALKVVNIVGSTCKLLLTVYWPFETKEKTDFSLKPPKSNAYFGTRENTVFAPGSALDASPETTTLVRRFSPGADSFRDQENFLVELFVDSLDQNAKMEVLQVLKRDLNLLEELLGNNEVQVMQNTLQELREKGGAGRSGVLLMDKIEILLVISIRLTFLLIKFSIPLLHLLIDKFFNNEIYVVNSRNFNLFLSVLIRLMEFFETKLSDKNLDVYKYGSQAGEDDNEYLQKTNDDLSELYNEMTENAASFLNDQIGDRDVGEKATWKASLAELVLRKYLGKSPARKDFHKDARYTQYFSQKLQSPENEPMSTYTTPPTTRMGAKDSPSSNLPSDNVKNVTMLDIVEQFVDEF